MRTALYYDSLLGKGGAQRVVIELANRLNADIITSGFNPKISEWLPIKGKIINIGNITHKYSIPLSFFFEVPLRFLFYKNNNYDLYIYFGFLSIFSARKNQNNVWFCFTPNRLLYDLKEWKLQNSSLIKKLFFMSHILTFKMLDQFLVKNNIQTIIAQTKTVQKRIEKYYNRKDSRIIYSPLNISQYRFNHIGEYYLTVSRLMPEKRVDIIAKVFTKLRDKQLIIVGDGQEKSNIQSIIKDHHNIKLLTDVNENDLIDLYANCIAVIYLPIDEDFGLVPIEAMASGKICIASNEGGCKETIIHGKTGYLINVTEKNLINIIKKINEEKLIKMKNDCILQAEKFDIDYCIEKWRSLLN